MATDVTNSRARSRSASVKELDATSQTEKQEVFGTFARDEITDEMLAQAATLFSEHYGIWSRQSPRNPGQRVKLSKGALREMLLPTSSSTYTRVLVDGTLAGHAFACRWTHGSLNVCWVTQLVVHRDYRRRGLATGLLRAIRRGGGDGDDAYGIASSQPAACLAAAAAFDGRRIGDIPLDFLRNTADPILKASPVRYLREARLRGTLFDAQDSTGLVSGVDTAYFVDHEEPLQVLEAVRRDRHWPLGDLPEGHEFFLLVSRQRGLRSRSRSPARRSRSRSPDRRTRSRSPDRRPRSRSPDRRSRSPARRFRSRSPARRSRHRSSERRSRSRSPARRGAQGIEPPPRRPDFSQEERKRGQRLFGGLLSTLSQKTANPHLKRRQEVDKKQQEKAHQRRAEADRLRAEKLAKLHHSRKIEQISFDEQAMRTRHSSTMAMAHSLKTRSEPALYYRPWELTTRQEQTIRDQIRDAEATLSREVEEFARLKDQKLRELGVVLPAAAPAASAHQPDSPRRDSAVSGGPTEPSNSKTHAASPHNRSPAEGSDKDLDDSRDVMIVADEDTVIY